MERGTHLEAQKQLVTRGVAALGPRTRTPQHAEHA